MKIAMIRMQFGDTKEFFEIETDARPIIGDSFIFPSQVETKVKVVILYPGLTKPKMKEIDILAFCE